MTQPLDMGVHDDSLGFFVGDAEDDTGSFPATTGELNEVSHGVGDLAGVFFSDGLAAIADGFGFVVVEAGRFNEFLQFASRGGRIVSCRAVVSEQGGSDLVDALVRALGAEDGGNQQLQWVRVIELAMDIGVGGAQGGNDFFCASR